MHLTIPFGINKCVDYSVSSGYYFYMLKWSRNRSQLIKLAKQVADSDFFQGKRRKEIRCELLNKIISFYEKECEKELLNGYRAIFPEETYGSPAYPSHWAQLKSLTKTLDDFYENDEGKKESRYIEIRFYFYKPEKINNQPRDFRLHLKANGDFIDANKVEQSKKIKEIPPKMPINMASDSDPYGKSTANIVSLSFDWENNAYEHPKEEVQTQIISISKKLGKLRDEKFSAELLGLISSANAYNDDIYRYCTQIEILKDIKQRIERGYEFWDKSHFDLDCENGGFDCVWKILAVIEDGHFRSDTGANIRVPEFTHKDYKKAVDSKLFTKFLVCFLFEMNNIEEDISNIGGRYYLFGASSFDENSLFLIAGWSSEDVK